MKERKLRGKGQNPKGGVGRGRDQETNLPRQIKKNKTQRKEKEK